MMFQDREFESNYLKLKPPVTCSGAFPVKTFREQRLPAAVHHQDNDGDGEIISENQFDASKD